MITWHNPDRSLPKCEPGQCIACIVYGSQGREHLIIMEPAAKDGQWEPADPYYSGFDPEDCIRWAYVRDILQDSWDPKKSSVVQVNNASGYRESVVLKYPCPCTFSDSPPDVPDDKTDYDGLPLWICAIIPFAIVFGTIGTIFVGIWALQYLGF